MHKTTKLCSTLWLASLASVLLLVALNAHGQTTPNVKVEILGTGAESLIGGDLTDPENDGLDELGAATDPSWNWAGITSSHESDFEGGENSFNIFDNKVGGGNDKWCCDDPTADNPVWVAVEFKQPVSLTYFTVASGNDSPDRDPTDWAIQGSGDGITYKDIYHFTDTTVPWTERNQVAKFTLPGPSAAYKFIRYIAWETPGSLHQINEIEYFGIVGGATVVDTDKDGMPDDYETEKGFNPNDATDAAKDFDGDGVSNLDEYKAGSDPIDTTKPTLLSASTTGTFDTVILTFSEALDPATATNVANYALSPSLAVTAAAYKNKVVTLTTAKQTAGATAYTVTVKGVTDLSKNAVADGTKATFYSYLMTKNGALKFSYWGGIESTPIQNLLDDPRYPATPDQVGAVFSFNSRDYFADDSHENYGATLEGYLTPTESGSYRFFIYSDDASALFLSTDDKEANLAQIAEETGCCNNFTEPDSPRTSEPIALVAGKKYFVRLIYKEGGGGDYGQVAWRKEGDTTAAGSLTPIPGKYLSSAVDLPAPAEGRFISQSPAPNAKGVKPNTGIKIVHADGKTEWTAANVSLKLDGTPVTPKVTKDGSTITIEAASTGFLPSNSTHTITLGYQDPGGQPASMDWSFTTYTYNATTKDAVKGISGLVVGKAAFTADAGGKTGKAGDYAMDFGKAGGAWVDILDATFLNDATKNDTLSIAFWQNRYDISSSSPFWANSTTAGGGRGYQAHTPWSDSTIYFDTGGCCDAATQRINANIDTFADYTGDESYWKKWHHIVLTKKADQKNIYIDGKLFLNGSSTNPLGTDFNELALGTDGVPGADFLHGILDDFAVYSNELTLADAAKLASGTAPKELTGSTLIALWDFNDAKSSGGSTSIAVARSANGITITFTGSGLQSATSLKGPWTDVSGVTGTTYTVQTTGTAQFFRPKP